MVAATTVALYSGLIIEGDAISASLLAKLAALRRANGKVLDVETVAFCQFSNIDDPDIQIVAGGVLDLLGREDFRRASLHIFEFGIYYQLFNVAHLLAPGQMAAIYHNITPRELISDPEVQAAIDRSMQQKHLLARMSHVACVSEFSRLELLEFGIPASQLSVLPLPGSFDGCPSSLRGGRASSEPVRFLFVGRLVRAKGVLDLLAATRLLVDSGESGFEMFLSGRIDFSDTMTTEGIEGALKTMPGVVRCLPDASSEDIAAAYENADVFLMPSYHEGYCVPIVEAFRAACPVIAYDNTNIPLVSGGLADLVPTGDVEGLARAMKQAISSLRAARAERTPYQVATAAGPIPEPEWRALVLQRVDGLQVAHDDGFVALVRDLLYPAPTNSERGWRRSTIPSLHDAQATPT
jgi:glycosyltransferase involved in cell wall biosynthesis